MKIIADYAGCMPYAQWAAALESEARRINALLIQAGEVSPDSLSRCVRAALGRGALTDSPFTGTAAELDAPIQLSGTALKCEMCSKRFNTPTVRQLLRQPDYGAAATLTVPACL